jgi:hypothetical protein
VFDALLRPGGIGVDQIRLDSSIGNDREMAGKGRDADGQNVAGLELGDRRLLFKALDAKIMDESRSRLRSIVEMIGSKDRPAGAIDQAEILGDAEDQADAIQSDAL